MSRLEEVIEKSMPWKIGNLTIITAGEATLKIEGKIKQALADPKEKKLRKEVCKAMGLRKVKYQVDEYCIETDGGLYKLKDGDPIWVREGK